MAAAPQPTAPSTPKLLVHAIDEKAKWKPNDTFMRYPGAEWEMKGYASISWVQYTNAINKVACWLDKHLGSNAEDETIAYFGPDDPRYAIIVPASIKTSRKVICKHCY